MPLGPRRATRPAIRRSRRKLVWATFDNNFTLPGSAPAVSTVDLLGQFELAGTSKLGVTVMRTHLKLYLSTTLGTEQYEIGVGVVRLTDIGTTRVNPNGDNDLNWALFTKYWSTFSGATADKFREITIDLRSRRRVEEMGETFALSVWSNTISENVAVFARTLVALP